MPAQISEPSPGGNVPNLDPIPIYGCGRQPLPIRRERQATNILILPEQCAPIARWFRLPGSDRSVITARDDLAAIRGKGHRGDLSRMASKQGDPFS